MTASDLIRAIEKIANPAWQASWDKSGIQVASPRQEVRQLGIFLDPVPGQIQRALDAGCDFLLSHHPLTLKPELPAALNSWYEALRLLMRAGVCLYAAHTSLDVNLAGPAGWLGRALGLSNIDILEPLPGHEGLGYGLIGDLGERLPVGRLVSDILGLAGVECGNICGPEAPEACRRVAICGGSGASLIRTAKARGADLYVTGDIKYHDAIESEVLILDVGHHSLEEEMMRRLAARLASELTDIHVNFFKSQPPFRRACQ
ncbi:MAG: Nif3-like dinuclear metal center hexameric protein [Desulfovibrio sp.]|nr:Nif3-like dinuclear metal center hexameric protein [Desulfovibrio sp.]